MQELPRRRICHSEQRPDGALHVARLVGIGHGRKMFIACRGNGTTTVVLIAGRFEAGWLFDYALDRDDPVLAKGVRCLLGW